MTWRLSGYVVESLVGFGGSGEVWRGHSTSTGIPVALKRVPVADPAQVLAARAEAAMLSALDHPNLVRLHELVETDDAVVLVLDLASGGSLAELIERRGRLTPGEVITALTPIAAALAYAHDHGVVHGDVTSANVLLTDTGLPLLTDLGVARIVGDLGPARSTPAFLDPAVAAGCAPGPSSDVFMLGAVGVHALTGAPLWGGSSPSETVVLAAAGDLSGLRSRLADVPRPLAAVLEQALEPHPHLRTTAADLVLDLRHAGSPRRLELAAGRPRTPPVPPPAPRRGPRHAAGRVAEEPGRPAFLRPDGADAGVEHADGAAAQLTHGVRVAPTPILPERRPRFGRLHAAGVGATVLACAATVLVLRVGGDRTVPRPVALVSSAAVTAQAATPQAATPPSATPQAARPPSATPQAARPPSATPQAAGASPATVLAGLDALRQRAFAERSAALLAQVYVAGPLLTQDTALLVGVVPVGCSLRGVHTDYAAPQSRSARPGHLVVDVTGTLSPSVLSCPGQSDSVAPGTKATRLRIDLVRDATGYRIAGQAVLPQG